MAFGLDDPGKQRAVLLGVLAVAFGYGFYQYLWTPLHEERLLAEEQLGQLERYNDQARALTQPRRIDELKRQEAEYEIALAAYETMLPSEAEVAGLLADVAAAAARNAVEIVQFAPLDPTAGANLTELPYDVQVQGAFHDIGRFLAEVANLPRLVRPSVTAMEQVAIQVVVPEGEGESEEGPDPVYQVVATLRLSTFVPAGEIETVAGREEDGEPSRTSALAEEESDAS